MGEWLLADLVQFEAAKTGHTLILIDLFIWKQWQNIET